MNKINKVYDIAISTDAGVVHILPGDDISISMTKELPTLEVGTPFTIKNTFKVEGDFLDLKFIS